MWIPVPEAVRRLDERGLVKHRRRDQSELIIDYVETKLGRRLPEDLADFYRANVDRLGDFDSRMPTWNAWTGWREDVFGVTSLLMHQVVPIMNDGCGNVYAVDISSDDDQPAVYFIDEGTYPERLGFAVGSSIGAFLLLQADHDRAHLEGWPPRWELQIDPDLERCPRAPAIWNAG